MSEQEAACRDTSLLAHLEHLRIAAAAGTEPHHATLDALLKAALNNPASKAARQQQQEA